DHRDTAREIPPMLHHECQRAAADGNNEVGLFPGKLCTEEAHQAAVGVRTLETAEVEEIGRHLDGLRTSFLQALGKSRHCLRSGGCAPVKSACYRCGARSLLCFVRGSGICLI